MARKLSPEEAAVLMEAVSQQEESSQEEQIKTRRVTAGHDTAFMLSPESGAWFGIEVPAWSHV